MLSAAIRAALQGNSIMALHFRYSAFFVRDVPATVAFYDKAFGFKQRYMHPSSGYAELDTGIHPALLHQR
jgi:catechol 2,3-dioxygenase-like lactoylglutathione lyase family enzyme